MLRLRRSRCVLRTPACLRPKGANVRRPHSSLLRLPPRQKTKTPQRENTAVFFALFPPCSGGYPCRNEEILFVKLILPAHILRRTELLRHTILQRRRQDAHLRGACRHAGHGHTCYHRNETETRKGTAFQTLCLYVYASPEAVSASFGGSSSTSRVPERSVR